MQTPKLKMSIRYKILFVVSALLVAAITAHLILADHTFRTDKTELTFELNRTEVTTLAADLETTLHSTVDKLRLFTMIYSQRSNQSERQAFKQILESDPFLVRIALQEKNPQGLMTNVEALTQKSFKDMYNVEENFFDVQLLPARPVPYEMISASAVSVWNATIQNGPPLVGIGVLVETDSKKEMYVVGFLKADRFLKHLVEAKVTNTYVVDSTGHVVIHPQPELMASAADFSKSDIVNQFRKSLNSSMGTVVKKFESGNDRFLGAFSRVGVGGLGVISQTDEKIAFMAVNKMIWRSMMVGLIVITLTLMFTVVFSRSLTDPLRRLMGAMEEVAAGNLDTEFHTATSDEIGVLSAVFNDMTKDLKSSRTALEEINRDLEEKVRERTRQLEEMAVKDALTGLYNRRFFNDKMKSEMDRARRYQTPVSIIYLDIDHFKKYNDQNGHPEGDTLLKGFAQLLSSSIRSTDVVARLGGEEFCVILPHTDLRGAAEAAEKIRKAVESTDFPHGEKQPLGRVTCSLGVSEFPSTCVDDETIIKAADEALYHVKEGGRNKVGVAKPPPGFSPEFVPAEKQAS